MKLGPYEIQGELGRGGMGVVFRGRAPDGRTVAVKLLKGGSVARFDRERRLLAELAEEDGFVPLLDAGDSPSGPWIAMPLLGGGTLRARMGRISREEVPGLGVALARAIARAHERGIVHRDLKPENVLFTASGVPLVADLGLAKHFSSDARTLSLSVGGELRGTVGYMPPEQLDDAKSVTDKADVFALGAILYEALAGRPAFAGSSTVEVLAKVATGDRERLAALCPDAPRWLVVAIDAALALSPEERPSASELARALEERRALAGPPPRRPRALALLVLPLLVLPFLAVAGAFLVPMRREARLPAPDALGQARAALSAHRLSEALEHARRALVLEPASRAEAIAFVVSLHAVAVETSDWLRERDALLVLEVQGEAARVADAHLLARIAQAPAGPSPAELDELCARDAGALARRPLSDAVSLTWDRARTLARMSELLEKGLAPLPEQRERVASAFLDEVAAGELALGSSTLGDSVTPRLLASFGRSFRWLALARRVDPSIDPFPPRALALLGKVRFMATMTMERHSDWQPLVAAYPEHPTLRFVHVVANLRQLRVVDGKPPPEVAAVLSSLEACRPCRARQVLAETLLLRAFLEMREAAELIPRFEALIPEGSPLRNALVEWRLHGTTTESIFSLPGPQAELDE